MNTLPIGPTDEFSMLPIFQGYCLNKTTNYGYWVLGLNHYKMKDYKEAVVAFENALRLDPNNKTYRKDLKRAKRNLYPPAIKGSKIYFSPSMRKSLYPLAG